MKEVPVKMGVAVLGELYQFTVKALLMLELIVALVPAHICVFVGVGSGAEIT